MPACSSQKIGYKSACFKVFNLLLYFLQYFDTMTGHRESNTIL